MVIRNVTVCIVDSRVAGSSLKDGAFGSRLVQGAPILRNDAYGKGIEN